MNLFSVESRALPDNAFLHDYTRRGAYTDCYRTEIRGEISHPGYVTAFYTTPLFKLERLILAWAFSKPSTDAEAERLAHAQDDSFAAWIVERRADNQLLLSDFKGRTRSWLMVEPAGAGSDCSTLLYFGSAVLPLEKSTSAEPAFGRGFSLLIRLHRFYSVLLLCSARFRLRHGVCSRNSHNQS